MSVSPMEAAPAAHNRRPPLTALSKLILVLQLLPIPWYIVFQIVYMESFFPPIGPINTVAALVVSYFVSQRENMEYVIWGVLGTLSEINVVGYHLQNPGDFNNLMNVLGFIGFILTFISGVLALRQNLRQAPGERVTPRWFAGAVTAVIGFLLGAAAVVLAYRPGAHPVLPAEVVEGLPTVTTLRSDFTQKEITIKATEQVVLRLRNEDQEDHSFDIDELNVHVFMPAKGDAVAVLKGVKPGTYPIYCRLPGHTQAGHTTGMVAKLVVTP